MKYRWFVLWILIPLLPHCASIPKKTATGLRPDRFWEDQKFRGSFLESVSGKLYMSYKHPKESAAGQGRVLFSQNRMRLELRDPLGKLHYVAVSDGKTFTAYFPTRALAYRDSVAGRAYFEKYMGFRFSSSEFRDLLVGTFPVSVRSFSSWEWDDSEGMYVGVTTQGAYRFRVWVDGDKAVIRKLKWSTKDDELVVSYGDYFIVKDAAPNRTLWAPGEIGVVHQRSASSIQMEWKDLEEIRKGNLSNAFELELPKSVSIVPLDRKGS